MFEMVISGDGCERAKLMPSLEVLAIFGTDFVWPHTVGLKSNTVGLSGSVGLSCARPHSQQCDSSWESTVRLCSSQLESERYFCGTALP